jgi:acetyl esterase/lipase
VCGWALASLALSSGCERAPSGPAGQAEPTGLAIASQRPRREPTATPKAGADGGTLPVEVPARELSWRFEQGPFGPTDVVIVVPPVPDAAARFPVLVAFHGRGESSKGSVRGARGWLDDYLLGRAVARLEHPPLEANDFEGYVTAERLEQINGALRARPYAGLIVVCPFLPDVLSGERAWVEGERLAAFVVDTLLPRVYAKTPALATAASTGVDGVSLGGRAALLVGLSRPRAFGSVGSLQAALDVSEVERFAALAAQGLAQNPALALRLLTSDEDYFRSQNQALSAALRARAVPHALAQVKGTHSYAFNRGPGVLEMLLFHSRVLRGQLSLESGAQRFSR